MILSDGTLRKLMADGTLSVEPITEAAIQPASIDLRLGTRFLALDLDGSGEISLDSENRYREFEGDAVTLAPHSFLLASSAEYVRLPDDITAFVEGRSSIGRIGLSIQNAGWVDPGFEGHITLQLFNANDRPISLTAGRRVCQLVFCRMDCPAVNPYRGKYHGQLGPGGSRVHLDPDANGGA